MFLKALVKLVNFGLSLDNFNKASGVIKLFHSNDSKSILCFQNILKNVNQVCGKSSSKKSSNC